MPNIRVDVTYKIKDGSEVIFKSPCDCSAVTGLIVYSPDDGGATVSQEFIFADAHKNDVSEISELFKEDVIVKVILDTVNHRAYVQNADTNAYLEGRFDDKYDVPTKVTSGEKVHFETPTNFQLISLKGEGKSEQFTTTGKNLIDLTQLNANTPISMKVSACDKSNVKSNSITLTAGGTWSNLYFVFPENYFAENEDIVVCANFLETIAGRTSPVGFVISGSNNNVDYTEIKRAYPINAEYNKSTFISLTANVETYKYIRIRIWINSTATEVTTSESVVNISEVMIARGTDDTYEPYTGGASPNPDYPQEIKTIQAYNLFNKDNVNTLDGFLDHNEKVFTLGNTARTLYIECKENTTYTISKTLGARFRTATSNIIPNGGEKLNVVSHDGSKKVTLTTNAGDKYLLVYYYSSTYDTTITEQEILSSIQIAEGNMPKSYVPYGCIPYVGRGKNLLNIVDAENVINEINVSIKNQEIKVNGTGTSGKYPWIIITKNGVHFRSTTPNAEYIKSISEGIIAEETLQTKIFKLSGTSNYEPIIDHFNSQGVNVNNYIKNGQKTDLVAVAIYLGNNKTYTDYTMRVQVERGNNITEYEPYKEVKLPIDLKGNELASVGDVKDKLLIDRKGNVAIEKNVGKVVLNGESNVLRGNTKDTLTSFFYASELIKLSSVIKSNYFINESSYGKILSAEKVGITAHPTVNRVYFCVENEVASTVDEIKLWLQENNVTVYYELATPELISLGTIENPEIFKGINNIVVETNIGNMQIEVEYSVTDLEKRFKELEDKDINLEERVVDLENRPTGGGNGDILIFENVTVATTDWVEDFTYEEFGYRAEILCEGVTENHFPEVVFNISEAISGNYSPIAVTYDGVVIIFAVNPPDNDITIPTISCSKGA